jgi:Uncharacterized conserved protein
MANFANPFQGNCDRKLTKEELIQALRIDIAAELEAMFLYEAHAMATDDPLVQKVLRDIRDEEKEHAGELLALMRYLDPETAELLYEGHGEVKEMMEKLNMDAETIKKATGPIGEDD